MCGGRQGMLKNQHVIMLFPLSPLSRDNTFSSTLNPDACSSRMAGGRIADLRQDSTSLDKINLGLYIAWENMIEGCGVPREKQTGE